MLINETVKIERTSVVLQRDVDFKEIDLELGEFAGQIVISNERLQDIAKANGFDKCERCKSLARFDQEFINAVFIKFLD